MKTFVLLARVCLALAVAPRLMGQPIPDALFTAGTTTTDVKGRPWAYLSFRPTDDRVLLGRSLAVYLKRGLPADPGRFERQGVVAAVQDVAVLAVLLDRGRQIGEDMPALESVLGELYRSRVGERNGLGGAVPASGGVSMADMLSALLGRGAADAETAQLLRLLGQAHPSVKMALGEGWAGVLSVPMGQPVTLEVRDVTPSGDGGVVGRVTLTAGQPVLLPPPGPPVQVPDLSPKGDLNIKLRWGQADELRRQSPLGGGFTVWRVLRSFAVAQGVENAAPSQAQLKTWLASGDTSRLSDGPILVSKVLSLADAANVVADATNYFVVDDGNRYRRNAAGEDIDSPMAEGTEFTYFVTALDILGRDGPPSLPGHGIACRTLPPPVPNGLRVENYWEPRDAAGTQSFQFFWTANMNNGRDVTDYYEVFRGTDLTQLQSDPARATLVPVSGNLVHGANGVVMSFLDVAPEVLASDFGETFWYSVRAVHVSPCGPIVSDFAAPVLIARRQREGPAAPSGFVDGNCHRASVIVANQEIVSDPAIPANDGMIRLRVLCQRIDNGIASVDFTLRVGGEVIDLGQHVYAAEGDWVVADYAIHRNELAGRPVVAVCRATTHTGALSWPKEVPAEHLNSEGRREITFQARTLSDADLVPGDAFSDEWLEAPVTVPAVAFPDGSAVALQLEAWEGRDVVVQTAPLGGAAAVYTRRGHGGVRNGMVSFSVPPVAEGQAQPALTARAYAVRELGESRCVDLAYNPGTGLTGKLGITLFTTPRSAEYRLFRRIDEGPYTLVSQGAAAHQVGQLNQIRRDDEALPVTDCTICYYAQTVDRDGNASALVRLEPCIQRQGPTLPKPNLSPPEALGTVAAAQMKLTWMCAPQNVERFLITIKAKGGATAKSVLENASKFTLTAPMAARVVQYHGIGGDLARTPSTQASGPVNRPDNGGTATVLSLASGAITFQKMVQTSTFVTPPLGNGYPAAPPFSAEFDVQPGVTYVVFVQAVRGPILGGQGRGPVSGTYEFRWSDPSVPEPQVAWPARPLETVTTQAGIEAGELHPVLWPSRLNGERPVGVRLASMLNARGEDVVVDGAEVIFAPTPDSPNYRRTDPNGYWLGNLGNGVAPTQGVVLYRQQVANSLFPKVPGDTIQVSPLIRKIAWIPTRTNDQRQGARLVDPFFGLTMTAPPPEAPGESAVLNLWLLDNQGVIQNARYHYYLVCLGSNGEVRQTLDAGFYGPP